MKLNWNSFIKWNYQGKHRRGLFRTFPSFNCWNSQRNLVFCMVASSSHSSYTSYCHTHYPPSTLSSDSRTPRSPDILICDSDCHVRELVSLERSIRSKIHTCMSDTSRDCIRDLWTRSSSIQGRTWTISTYRYLTSTWKHSQNRWSLVSMKDSFSRHETSPCISSTLTYHNTSSRSSPSEQCPSHLYTTAHHMRRSDI